MTLTPARLYAISELLPHGAGFRLLDTLLDYGQDHVRCRATITPRTPFFVADHGVPGWVGIEYMAQTIAAYSGIIRRQSARPVELGLLLGTRRYQCTLPYFLESMELTVSAEQLVRDASGIVVFRCSLRDGLSELASAEIKAFQPDDVHGYLHSLETST